MRKGQRVDITLSKILVKPTIDCSQAYNWCCNSLRLAITYREFPSPARIVLYRHVWREFSIPYGKSEAYTMADTVEYCPYCGSRFPRSLWDDWYSILDEEYNLTWGDEPLEEFLPKVPPEFRSDEWWKKRGL